MSRNATITTLPSLKLATGGFILWSGTNGQQFMPDVAEQLNWSFQQRPKTYISAPTGSVNWDGRFECRVMSLAFNMSNLNNFEARLQLQVKLDLDFLSYTVGAQCNFAAAETGTVRFTLGAATPVTLNFTNATNGQLLTTTILQSASGAGWQTFLVELEGTAGSSTTDELRYIYLADTPNPALPAPANV